MGALGELIASTDLLMKGFHVYRAMSPAAPADLVIFKTPTEVYTVEVRTGRETVAGKLHCNDQVRYDVDLLAVVVHREMPEVVYFPKTSRGEFVLLHAKNGKGG